MNEPTVETILLSELTEADTAAMQRLGQWVYPPGSLDRFTFPKSAPASERDWPEPQRARAFVIREGNEILAMSRLLPRRVHTQAGPLEVLALAGVKSHPNRRGEGLGRAVVRAAFARVDDGVLPVSLFQTGVPGFYRKLGCREVHNRFVNSLGEDPSQSPWWDKAAMIYPSAFDWPAGEVDTLGAGW